MNKNKKFGDATTGYEVFIRKEKRFALSCSLQTSWLYGALYAGLFFISLPIFIWRYGFRNGILLILVPLAIGIGISLATGDFGTPDSLFIGFISSSILRPIVGMFVYINDRKLLIARILKRNWEYGGRSMAGSKRLAVKEFSIAK
jgi:hypothetical protein